MFGAGPVALGVSNGAGDGKATTYPTVDDALKALDAYEKAGQTGVWCDVSRIAATFYADEKGDDAEGIAEAATVRVERGRLAYSLYVGREPDEGDEGQVAVGGYNGWAVAEARVSAATAVDDLPIKFALGQNKSDRVWKPQETTWGAFAKALQKHVPGAKDGRAFTQGACLKKTRAAKEMDAMYMVGVDLDSGQSLEEVKAKIESKGLECVAYTTHSHLITSTEINRDHFAKWSGENGGKGYSEYLIDVRNIVPEIANTAEAVSIEGFTIKLKHKAIPKFRLVFPLEQPFVFNELSLRQDAAIDKWKRVYAGFCDEMGFAYDKACIDPSRLFFFPRHSKGTKRHDALHIEGQALDWREVTPAAYVKGVDRGSDDPYVAAGNAEAGQAGGTFVYKKFDLKQWSAKVQTFEIRDAIEAHNPDVLHGDGKHIICPFEGNHSKDGGEGTFVKNGCDTDSGEGFVICCNHNGCADRDRLEFVQAMLEQGYLTLDQLRDESELVEFKEGVEGPQATADDLDALAADIDAADKTTVLQPFYARLAAVNDAAERGRLTKRLAKVTGAPLVELKREVRKAGKPKGRKVAKDGGLPVISTSADFREQVEQASKALQARAEKGQHLYRFNGAIARVARSEGLATYIEALDVHALRYEIQESARFELHTGDDVKEVRASRDVAEHLFQAPAEGYRPLKAIVQTPVFAADGSLITSPGYHAPSRLYFDPPDGFVVPDVPATPSGEDVEAAKGMIFDHLYVDFPFYGETDGGQASRAHALCLLLQEFVREMIAGATPIYLLDKPMAGTGAGKFMNATTIVWTGHGAKAQTEAGTEDERRKNITASLLDGPAYYFLDNINRTVDSSAYASVTTSDTWVDRPLGTSKKVEVPIRCAWIFCGNNPQLSGELARRCVRIRLDAKSADPTAGRTFLYPDLEGWAKGSRGQLVGACLTLIRAWIADGRPKGSTGTLASFEAWSDVMGGILDVCSVPGFLGNVAELRADMNHASGDKQQLLEDWFEEYGTEPVTVGDGLINIATVGDDMSKFPELPFTNYDGRINRTKFGRYLARMK